MPRTNLTVVPPTPMGTRSTPSFATVEEENAWLRQQLAQAQQPYTVVSCGHILRLLPGTYLSAESFAPQTPLPVPHEGLEVQL